MKFIEWPIDFQNFQQKIFIWKKLSEMNFKYWYRLGATGEAIDI